MFRYDYIPWISILKPGSGDIGILLVNLQKN